MRLESLKCRIGERVRSDSTVLVTGAAGFVGSNLVSALRASVPSAELLGLDRLPVSGDYDSWLEVDLCNEGRLRTLLNQFRVDAVVHLAAQSYVPDSISRHADYVRDNVLGTSTLLSVLQDLPEIPRVILASSCEVYGDQLAPANEAVATRPKSPYAATKLSQESLLQASWAGFGTPYSVFRFFNNYGPGQQENRLLPQILRSAATGRPFILHGDGSAIRDWIDVRDTCEAVVRALGIPASEIPPVVNIASQTPLSVTDVLEVVQGHGLAVEIKAGDTMPGHLESAIADAELARSSLGWKPERTLQQYLDEILRDRL